MTKTTISSRSKSARASSTSPTKRRGPPIFVERSNAIPLVDFQIALRTGTVADPRGREGLSRVVARAMRMGTKRLSARDVEARIDALGGTFGIDVSPTFLRMSGTVIRRNAEKLLDLVGDLIGEPAFRESDLAELKRETIAAFIEARDDDRGLAARHFRCALFGHHPYGRAAKRATIEAIEIDAVRGHYRDHFRRGSSVLGLSGAVDSRLEKHLVETSMRASAGHPPLTPLDTEPAAPVGRRVVIVDKPDRTQTQIYIGALGTRAMDPDHFPFVVGNAIFGGTFTSRLMRAVRSERGWSYGAYSRLGLDTVREAFSMWTFPSLKDAVACVELELGLLETLVEKGVTNDEVKFARSYLGKSFAFEVDTASKRLEHALDVELLALPRAYFRDYVENVRDVSIGDVNRAIRRRLDPKNLVIVIVAPRGDVEAGLAALPGVVSVDTVRYDDD